MKKLLKTQDILLLGLAGVLDLFEEIRDPLHLVSGSYKNMYGWVPEQYKKHNFMHLVWRNIKTGYIEKMEKRGEVYIRLTSQGNKRIIRDFPVLSLQNRKWDKRWRVVIFDIEEINRNARDALREKLRELGFGMIQKSVFISPHDIIEDFNEFIKSAGLKDVVYVFEAQNLATGSAKELSNKVWNLNFINEKYRKLIEKIETEYLIVAHDRGKMLNSLGTNSVPVKGIRDRINVVREVRREYLQVVMRDPFLPKELLPIDWKGEKARALIKELRRFKIE